MTLNSVISVNPLLEEPTGTHHYLPLDQVRPEHFPPAFETALLQARTNIDHIVANAQEPTFANTIEALEVSGELLSRVQNVFWTLLSAEGPAALHQLSKEIGPKLSEFQNSIYHNANLFRRVQAVWHKRQELSGESLMLLEETYQGFVRNGALLDVAKKKRLMEIGGELSQVSAQYSEHVLNATNAYVEWIDQETLLQGIPPAAVTMMAAEAQRLGGKTRWAVTLHGPIVGPVLSFADDEGLRQRTWQAFRSRSFGGQFDNRALVLKTVKLRAERAEIMGYPNHAAYVLERRMAETPERVQVFLDRLVNHTRPKAEADMRELKDFIGSEGSQWQPWNLNYFSEKLRVRDYDFHSETLRPYFATDRVVEGVFEHARRLYGLRFVEVHHVPVYHPDVRVFEVDENNGAYVGTLYVDLYPRPQKKSGAWMMSIREQGLRSGDVIHRPHVGICCNFPRSTPEHPSLLSLSEVRTLFHEFGHALHGLLTRCTYTSLSGTNVSWDFVELPSQIMENWIRERESLDIFARHFQTGEPIPQDLYQKMARSQHFQAGLAAFRQYGFCDLDLAWHTLSRSKAEALDDVVTFENHAMSRTDLIPLPAGTNLSCSFSHIFSGGYSAGYYSYKWAEVLDADAFEFFKEKGIFDRDVADRFRSHVLERGGTEKPMILYQKFRGREPDPDALLRRDGLVST